jgi:hypothetical protein
MINNTLKLAVYVIESTKGLSFKLWSKNPMKKNPQNSHHAISAARGEELVSLRTG